MDQFQIYFIPALLVGFLAWRIFKFKKVKAMVPHLIAEGAVVVDVRTPQEFAQGARPDSLNIPLNDFLARSSELDQTKTIILCCASGTRSGIALGILKQQGFKNVVNAGPWMNTLV
jgi:phage shock protein E